jgi:acyl carrier protein
MIAPTQRELLDLVIDWIKQNKLPTDDGDSQIAPNTDLITSGLLDSLRFIELIQFIETQIGCRIDLMNVAPSEFTVVKDLCDIGLRSGHNGTGPVSY